MKNETNNEHDEAETISDCKIGCADKDVHQTICKGGRSRFPN